jgi:hypothetical protein
MASRNNAQIMVLITVIIVLAGVVYWQQGTRDCEKRIAPLESRFIPIKGCEIRIGDSWHGEAEMKNSLRQGVKQMEEGGKKVMEGIFGKPPGAK